MTDPPEPRRLFSDRPLVQPRGCPGQLRRDSARSFSVRARARARVPQESRAKFTRDLISPRSWVRSLICVNRSPRVSPWIVIRLFFTLPRESPPRPCFRVNKARLRGFNIKLSAVVITPRKSTIGNRTELSNINRNQADERVREARSFVCSRIEARLRASKARGNVDIVEIYKLFIKAEKEREGGREGGRDGGTSK